MKYSEEQLEKIRETVDRFEDELNGLGVSFIIIVDIDKQGIRTARGENDCLQHTSGLIEAYRLSTQANQVKYMVGQALYELGQRVKAAEEEKAKSEEPA